MISDIIQCYIFNLPNGCDYGVETYESGRWVAPQRYVETSNGPLNVPHFSTYETACQTYSNLSEYITRLVKYSRYLINDLPVVHEVIKCNKQ